MKTLDFIFIGTPKQSASKELETEYHSRIKRYTNSKIQYLKDCPEKNTELKKKKESEFILSKIQTGDHVVICDENGKGFTTPKLAQKIESLQVSAQRIVFVIGGAYGMTDELVKRGQTCLRLSDFVLPHELARVVLLEQVYRCFTILKGEKYHH